jgi:hypothetical protein
MKQIKTFSELSESLGHTSTSDNPLSESASDMTTFKAKIGGWSLRETQTYVGLYDEPKEIYPANVIGGDAEWSLDIRATKWGLELGDNGAYIKSMTLTIEYEDTSAEEEVQKIIEVPGESLNLENITTEVHEFPLYLNSIDISMNGSMDPKDWKLTIHIGNIS